MLEPQLEDGLCAWNFFDEGLKQEADYARRPASCHGRRALARPGPPPTAPEAGRAPPGADAAHRASRCRRDHALSFLGENRCNHSSEGVTLAQSMPSGHLGKIGGR